jgi:hypothetical protein
MRPGKRMRTCMILIATARRIDSERDMRAAWQAELAERRARRNPRRHGDMWLASFDHKLMRTGRRWRFGFGRI